MLVLPCGQILGKTHSLLMSPTPISPKGMWLQTGGFSFLFRGPFIPSQDLPCAYDPCTEKLGQSHGTWHPFLSVPKFHHRLLLLTHIRTCQATVLSASTYVITILQNVIQLQNFVLFDDISVLPIFNDSSGETFLWLNLAGRGPNLACEAISSTHGHLLHNRCYAPL